MVVDTLSQQPSRWEITRLLTFCEPHRVICNSVWTMDMGLLENADMDIVDMGLLRIGVY